MEAIERATPGDLAALVELLGILFQQEADFEPDVAKQEKGLGLILENDAAGVVLVAREGSAIVGMVTLLFTVSTAVGARVCWLEDLVVHPNRRGGGIGTRLLRAAIDHATRRGPRRITLLTDGTNEGAARLYRAHGFAPSAMVPLRLTLDPSGARSDG
jgi:GNAT superfamily N-acetyltransferase